MKLKKIVVVGVMSLAVVFTSACGIFESGAEKEKDPFFDDGTYSSQKTPSDVGNEAHLQTPKENIAGPDNRFGNPKDVLGYTDGFGAKIPGVALEPVYFGFDSNMIPSSEMHKIMTAVAFLKSNPNAGIVIEGNCDSRGSDEYNRALGEKRALAAKEVLLQNAIPESRMKVISYGEERPAVIGENEDAWSKNRRDEFVAVYLLQ